MISPHQITEYVENATRDFRESPAYRDLVAGMPAKAVREFIRDVFRTHYLSSHIVALCFASLPSGAAALLKENLLEEMGRSEEEKPHSALLIELAQGTGFSEKEIDGVVDAGGGGLDAKRGCEYCGRCLERGFLCRRVSPARLQFALGL